MMRQTAALDERDDPAFCQGAGHCHFSPSDCGRRRNRREKGEPLSAPFLSLNSLVLCDTSGSAVSLVVAFAQADAVAWICLVIGTLVLSAGVLTGLWTSFKKAPQKTEEAIAKIDE